MVDENEKLRIEEQVADDFYASQKTFDTGEALSYSTVLQLMAAGAIFAASRGRVTPSSMPIKGRGSTGIAGSGRLQTGLERGGPLVAGGGLVGMVRRWFKDNETIPADEIIGKANANTERISTGNPLLDADLASDEDTQQQIDATLTPEEIAARISIEEKVANQLGNLQYDEETGISDPINRGVTNLINDAEFLATVNVETPAGMVTERWGALAKGGSPLLPGYGLGMPATIGVENIPYYEWYPGTLPAASAEPMTGRTWRLDEERIADGQSFIRKVEEDVPFTVQDAIAIYDAQDPVTQRLIAESLAIGSGGESFMAKALGNQMFTTPGMIYERESVMFGLMKLAEIAGVRASALGGGPEAFKLLDMIPALRTADFEMADPEALAVSGAVAQTGLTMGELTDELFDLATNLGVVKTIAQTHSRALAASVYRGLIGRNPDEFALELFDEWTEDAQKNTMGASNPTDSELRSFYASKIETEPAFEEELDMSKERRSMDSLAKAIKNL